MHRLIHWPLSARSTPARLATLTAGICFLAPALCLGAFTPFSDTFDNLDNWAAYSSDAAGSVAVSDGNLITNVGVTTSNDRTFVVSDRDDFNFFQQPLKVDLQIVDLAGTPVSGNENSFAHHYVMVGQSNANLVSRFYPAPNMLDAVYFRLEDGYNSNLATAERAFFFEAGMIKDADYNSYVGPKVKLSGEPTRITIELEGGAASTAWSVTLEGATFVDTGLATRSGTFALGVNDFGDGALYRLAIGSQNRSTVEAASVGTFSSVSVTAVPEPGAVAAVAGVLLAAARRRAV